MTARKETSSSSTAGPPFSPDWAFFLDVDGTLLELAARPEEVVIQPEHIQILEKLFRTTGGAVALISGRSIADLDRLFAPLQLPAAGLHGIERRDFNGRWHRHHQLDGKLDPARELLTRFADDTPGILLEDKQYSLAVHYRQVPGKEEEIESVIREIMPAIEGEFHLQRGKMVYEIKPSGRDKGVAIGEFMQEPPFSDRLPVFIGDDITDEDGFKIINSLNGYPIKVGNGNTVAGWVLPDTAAVLDMLVRYNYYLNSQQQLQQ